MTLHIQERIPEDRQQQEEEEHNTKSTRAVKRQWHVFMEFDLEEFGLFASDITIKGNSIKTKLWVQSTQLWSESQAHLTPLKKELESHGIDVEELNCFNSMPPEKPVKLNSSLIDIET